MANMTFKTNLLPNSTTLEYSLGSENQPWKINGYTLEDTYVKKSGDTMTGTLTITKSTDAEFIKLARTNLTKGTIPSENQWSGIYFIDSSLNLDMNGGRFGALQVKQEPNGNNNISLQAATNAVGSSVFNQLNLGISSTGTCYYSVSDPAAFRTALGLGARATDNTEYLPLAGGTMTGDIERRMTNVDASKTNNNVSGTQYPTTCWITDVNGKILSRLEAVIYTDGRIGGYWYCRNYDTSGTQIAQKGINMYLDKNGTMTYGIADAANFRSALGLGARATDSTAYLPLAGGTMTGNLRIKNAGPYMDCTAATRGTAYSGNYYRTAPEWIDSAGKRLAQIEYHKSNTNSDLFLYVLGDHTSSDQYSGIVINKLLGNTGSANVRIDANAGKLYGAVWNDYAEYRQSEITEPGRCIKETGNGDLILSKKRLEKGCEIISDTYGFAIGQSKKYNTPTACTGRVLAYPYESIEEFKKNIGQGVCSGPNGTVSIMTDEECRNWPQCIIGTISEIPNYDIWYAGGKNEGSTPIKVNNRIWIRVR